MIKSSELQSPSRGDTCCFANSRLRQSVARGLPHSKEMVNVGTIFRFQHQTTSTVKEVAGAEGHCAKHPPNKDVNETTNKTSTEAIPSPIVSMDPHNDKLSVKGHENKMIDPLEHLDFMVYDPSPLSSSSNDGIEPDMVFSTKSPSNSTPPGLIKNCFDKVEVQPPSFQNDDLVRATMIDSSTLCSPIDTMALGPAKLAVASIFPKSRPNQCSSAPPLVHTPQGIALLLNDTTKGHLTSNRRFQRWTEVEDSILVQAVELEGGQIHDWKKISHKYFRGSRNANQCKGRWKKALCPKTKRSPWSSMEDETILEGKRLGQGWPKIAAKLPGRTAEQVRGRFINSIDPTLKKGVPWTAEEVDILLTAQRRLGNKWYEISKLLPGRSENAVKNRWHNGRLAEKRAIRRQFIENRRVEKLQDGGIATPNSVSSSAKTAVNTQAARV